MRRRNPHSIQVSRRFEGARIAFCCMVGWSVLVGGAVAAERATKGLQALYDFQSGEGDIVKDRSGAGRGVDLKIGNPKAVRRSKGALEIRGAAKIASPGKASKIVKSVRASGEITLEAWIRPATLDQDGPARIVTLSRNSTERNFTLGQEKGAVDVRLRTTKTNANGIPSLGSGNKSLATRLMHVVYTRNKAGESRLYLDGKPVRRETIGGAVTNWGDAYRLALADEVSGGRPWRGTYRLVAIYSRALQPGEVRQNFSAGLGGTGAPGRVARAEPEVPFFESTIAPLLSEHCLECHDSATRKGKLDLSRKATAFRGDKDRDIIVPGKADASTLWESVASDEMPEDRAPLSEDEKKLLKQWIDSGAAWTLDVVDPTIYGHGDSGEVWVQRLTVPEYIETVRSSLGVDIAAEATELLPPDLRADGFSNTAYNLQVDFAHVNAYTQLAEITVSRMDVPAFAQRFTKKRLLTDDHMRDLITKMGAWVLRGPLEKVEVDVFRGISTTVASAGGDFEEAVGLILEAMLQSPRFIYRIEDQRGDGTSWPVGEYELASRLSYILWGGPPDQELIRVAGAGDLYDRNQVETQVRRMLGDPRAEARAARFVHEWLNLGRLANLRPDAGKFPGWDEALAEDMRRETVAFFVEVAWSGERPLSDLLNAQLTFVTPGLAKHYGLPAPAGGGADTLARVDLSAVPGRGGLLTQGSVLTVGGDEASMVSRGLFVLHDLLRGEVKAPPPCVDTTPVPTMPGLTQRGIAEQRILDKNCGGCHSKFEPLAFGLEKFDGIGSYHDKDEHGNPLRDDGEILFPGDAEAVPYQTSAELMNLLAESDRVRLCLTWKVAQFALGRPLTAGDAPVLRTIHEQAQKNGGTYAALITAIVTSDLVRMTRGEGEE